MHAQGTAARTEQLPRSQRKPAYSGIRPDHLRTLGILLVVLGHSAAQFVQYDAPAAFANLPLLLLNQLGRFTVPLFFVVSGASMFRSTFSESYFSYALTKIRQFLPPYLFWASFQLMLYLAFADRTWCGKDIVYHVVLGRLTEHFYFVPAFLAVLLLAPLLVPLARKPAGAVLLLAISLLTVIVTFYDLLPTVSWLRWPLVYLNAECNALLWIGWFAAGVWYMEHRNAIHATLERWRTLPYVVFGVMAVALLADCFYRLMTGADLDHATTHNRPVAFFYALCSMPVLFRLPNPPNRFRRTSLRISVATYTIYLCHVPLLNLFLYVSHFKAPVGSLWTPPLLLILFAALTAAGLIIHAMSDRLVKSVRRLAHGRKRHSKD